MPGRRTIARLTAPLAGALGLATWWSHRTLAPAAHLGDPVGAVTATAGAPRFLAALAASVLLLLVVRRLMSRLSGPGGKRIPAGVVDLAVAVPGLGAAAMALDSLAFRCLAGPLTGLGAALAVIVVSRHAAPPGRARRLVAVLALLLPLSMLARWPAPSGDEPHYLIVAESLVDDGDLDLRDDYADGVYRTFHPGALSPHYKPGAIEGTRYSMHGIGLPALLAPAYLVGRAIGGSGAVLWPRLFLVALYGLFAWTLHGFIRDLVGGRAALFGTLATSLTAPLVFAPLHLFPEVPAMLAACAAFHLLRRGRDRDALVAAAAVAALPWLGVKYLGIAVALVLASATLPGDAGRRRRALLVVGGALAASLAGHTAMTWTLYGSLSPMAVYLGAPGVEGSAPPALGGDPRAYLALWRGALATAVGYLLDQKEGLLLYGPHFLLAALGLGWMWRRRRRETVLLALVAAAHVGPYALSQQLGGQGPPVRPLMAVLWTLAPALGVGLALTAGRLATTVRAVAISWAAVLTAVLAAWPTLLPHDYPVRSALWIRAMTPAGSEVWRWFPQWVNVAEPSPVSTAVWTLGAVILVAILWVGGLRAAGEGSGPGAGSAEATAEPIPTSDRRPLISCRAALLSTTAILLLVALVAFRQARWPLTDRHVGTETTAGLTAWVPERLPERLWAESEGVWAAPGPPVGLVLESPRRIEAAFVRLTVLVETEVELILQGATLAGTATPTTPVAGRIRPGRPFRGGRGFLYHVTLRAGRGVAPAEVGDSADERVLGVFLRVDALEPVAGEDPGAGG